MKRGRLEYTDDGEGEIEDEGNYETDDGSDQETAFVVQVNCNRHYDVTVVQLAIFFLVSWTRTRRSQLRRSTSRQMWAHKRETAAHTSPIIQLLGCFLGSQNIK